MAEVLVEFDTVVVGDDGTRWIPQVSGGIADDGLWEGWIEFSATDSSITPVRTPRETEQSKRNDLMYWAQGLTQVYLEEALRRAIAARPADVAQPRSVSPLFDTPAPRPRRGAAGTGPRPILNPFAVYAQGEDILVQQLSGLDATRLRDIVVGYGFLNAIAASGQSREELTSAIMMGVRPRGTPNSDVRANPG